MKSNECPYVQATLTDYLNSLNVPIEEFYADVQQAKEETTDPYLLTFIDCLLASTDYDSFYRVMVREGKKLKADRLAAAKKLEADTKETTTRYASSAKVGRDDEGYSYKDDKYSDAK